MISAASISSQERGGRPGAPLPLSPRPPSFPPERNSAILPACTFRGRAGSLAGYLSEIWNIGRQIFPPTKSSGRSALLTTRGAPPNGLTLADLNSLLRTRFEHRQEPSRRLFIRLVRALLRVPLIHEQQHHPRGLGNVRISVGEIQYVFR